VPLTQSPLAGMLSERRKGQLSSSVEAKEGAVNNSPEEGVVSSLVAFLCEADASGSGRRAAARVGADVAHGRVAGEVGIAVGLGGGDGAQTSALLVDASETRLAVELEKELGQFLPFSAKKGERRTHQQTLLVGSQAAPKAAVAGQTGRGAVFPRSAPTAEAVD
jgi:hypothetical protein